MAVYEYFCSDHGLYKVSSRYFFDSPHFTGDECPICKVRGERRMSLPASRSPWNPHLSYRYGAQPMWIDSRDHDREIRRKLHLADDDVSAPNIDPYAKGHYVKERSAKIKEMKEKGKSAAQVGLKHCGANPPFLRDPVSAEEKKAKRERLKKDVREAIQKKVASLST